MANLSKSQLEALWVKAGGPRAQAQVAAAIALAESGGSPTARNPEGPEHAEGAWQIKGQLVRGNPFSPEVSAANAVAKYKAGGFKEWTTFTSGAYKKYLGSGSSSTPELIEGESSIPVVGAVGGFLTNLGKNTAESVNEALNPLSPVESFLGALVNPTTWLRVAEGVGGIILFMVGLKTLTRGSVGVPSIPRVGIAAAVGGEVGAKRSASHQRRREGVATEAHAARTQNRIKLAQKQEAARRATVRAEAKATPKTPRPKAPRTQTSTA